MSRSTFYYRLSHQKDRKNRKVMHQIKDIFNQHHGNYGYRRITCVLRYNGVMINHKKVKRLMSVMGLFGKTIRKRNHIKELLVKLPQTRLNVNLMLTNQRKNAIPMLLNLSCILEKRFTYHQ